MSDTLNTPNAGHDSQDAGLASPPPGLPVPNGSPSGARGTHRGLWLLMGLAAIAVIWAATEQYDAYRTEIEQRAVDQISAVADLKLKQVHQWRQELLESARWIQEASGIRHAAWRYVRDADGERQTGSDLRTWIESWRKRHRYGRVVLLDRELNVRLAAPETATWLGSRARRMASSALSSNEVLVSDFHLGEHGQGVNLDLLVPLYTETAPDSRREPAGVLVLEVDPETLLYPMVQSWPTPSRSAETLLVRRDGDAIQYLNRLRYSQLPPLELRHPLSQSDLPAVRAVLGETGLIRGTDYRGERVLAVAREIPDSPWYLVAKVDTSEVFESLQERAVLTMVLAGALIVCLALGLYLLWHGRQVEFERAERARKDAAQALVRQREQQLRSLYDSMTELVVLHELVTDPDGLPVDYRILDCNQAFTATTGIPRERAIGALASKLYGTGEAPLLQLYADVAATGKSRRFEFEFGRIRRRFDIAAFSSAPGRFATVSSDITDRKAAELALRDSWALYHSMVESLPLCLIRTDLHGRVVFCNDRFCSLMGRARDEMVGQSEGSLYPAALAQRHQEDDRLVASTGQSIERVEEHRIGVDAQRRFLQMIKTPVRDAAGAIVGVQVLFWDVTDRRAAAEERERLLKDLARKNEELELLLYAASHDLRAPLVNIQGFTRGLSKACAELSGMLLSPSRPESPSAEELASILKDRIPKALGFVQAGVERMDMLIHGLLRMSRLGQQPLNPQPVDMKLLVERVLAAQAHQIREAQAEVEVDGLPSCYGDPAMIDQVFSNLLDNAIKYRDPQRPLKIRFSGRVRGDEAIYCLQDNGIGIASAHQSKTWALFHRLHPEGDIPGEGLGLNIVRRVLDRHGGRAWMESTPGEGSRFYVSLPVEARLDLSPTNRRIKSPSHETSVF